jgi:hypothetical protein
VKHGHVPVAELWSDVEWPQHRNPEDSLNFVVRSTLSLSYQALVPQPVTQLPDRENGVDG